MDQDLILIQGERNHASAYHKVAPLLASGYADLIENWDPFRRAMEAGKTLRRKGHIRPAEESFLQAMALRPTAVEPWIERIRLRWALGELCAAEALLLKTLRAFPQDGEVPRLFTRLKEARLQAARTELAQAALIEGQTLCRAGEPEPAAFLFKRAQDLDPWLAEAPLLLAEVLLELGNRRKAQVLARRARALLPQDRKIQRRCAAILLEPMGKNDV